MARIDLLILLMIDVGGLEEFNGWINANTENSGNIAKLSFEHLIENKYIQWADPSKLFVTDSGRNAIALAMKAINSFI